MRRTVSITHIVTSFTFIWLYCTSTTLIINVNIITVILSRRGFGRDQLQEKRFSRIRLSEARPALPQPIVIVFVLFLYSFLSPSTTDIELVWLLFLSLFAYNNRYLNLHFIVYPRFLHKSCFTSCNRALPCFFFLFSFASSN